MDQQPVALLSVSDKTGLVDFARRLREDHGYALVSSGGTARALREAGLDVTEVGDWTGFPEMMDGRLKTLHPKVHGGLLCRRDKPEHLEAAQRHGIRLIDLVVVNLYPFEEAIRRPMIRFEEALEEIDIGGPALLRSAAKNHASVTVVTHRSDYANVLEALGAGGDRLQALRRDLAQKVFARTSAYDAAIAAYFEREAAAEVPDLGLPERLALDLPRSAELRYGENPHQQAALYGTWDEHFEQLQGKALSYNNLLDTSAAVYLIGEFEAPTVAILKHTNPCGVGTADTLAEAWDKAFETDRQAPFGGIVVVNQTVDAALAENIADLFTEVIIAPGFAPEARNVFSAKKNLRLLQLKAHARPEQQRDLRRIFGGVLVQDRDQRRLKPAGCTVVTERAPEPGEWDALMFGWKVVKHVKSNAICYTASDRTLGIGAGQMSRVDASRLAVWKARESGLSLEGSAVASDAFFPFADGVEAAAEAGARAVIQPGGSRRDEEVIAAANRAGLAMVFTGVRHFRH